MEEGFQLNHTWFKSERVRERIPDFEQKDIILHKIITLEKLCEKLSYGAPKPVEKLHEVLQLFQELETLLKRKL